MVSLFHRKPHWIERYSNKSTSHSTLTILHSRLVKTGCSFCSIASSIVGTEPFLRWRVFDTFSLASIKSILLVKQSGVKWTEQSTEVFVGRKSAWCLCTNFSHWFLKTSFAGNRCIETPGVAFVLLQLTPSGLPAAQNFSGRCFLRLSAMLSIKM